MFQQLNDSSLKKLETAIRSIASWETMSANVLLDALTCLNIAFQDDTPWTWRGLASVENPETGQRFGREGNRKLEAVLTANQETWLVSQLATGVVLTDSEIQATLYGLDQTGIVPGAKYVALAVKRNISLLESYQLPVPSIQEIVDLIDAMKLADTKQALEEAAWDRLQSYRIAVTEWDGTSLTEPVL